MDFTNVWKYHIWFQVCWKDNVFLENVRFLFHVYPLTKQDSLFFWSTSGTYFLKLVWPAAWVQIKSIYTLFLIIFLTSFVFIQNSFFASWMKWFKNKLCIADKMNKTYCWHNEILSSICLTWHDNWLSLCQYIFTITQLQLHLKYYSILGIVL